MTAASSISSCSGGTLTYKHEKFYKIEYMGEALIKTFDDIEKCIKDLETIIDEIKDAMISKSIYQNIKLIENYK
ncbi:hypothetical protein [Peribacillus asahii]|nr:hypothetical protein [Peribacillus asahii]USK83612.1 hypothetical protein LIT35_14245 [Peribacillus asahii]